MPHIVGGWAPPLLFVGIWAIVKGLTHNVPQCRVCSGPVSLGIIYRDLRHICVIQSPSSRSACPRVRLRLPSVPRPSVPSNPLHGPPLRYCGPTDQRPLRPFVHSCNSVIVVRIRSVHRYHPNVRFVFRVAVCSVHRPPLPVFTNVRSATGRRLVFRHRGALSVLGASSTPTPHSSRFRQSSEPNLPHRQYPHEDDDDAAAAAVPRLLHLHPMAKQAAHLKIPGS
ncbi:hypothetical protein BV898_05642 [Hypsibius exemplaris]|uniref:Secreted protein n=1 Tax=Hypsibius exemplaris TaxID=2072580 RepID=A0A1W0WYS7_HYPEX|nr:hypothetical protein BV898_05642 [Hypsibius exemplaris]